MLHHTQEERVLDAVKGFLGISKGNQTRGGGDVSVVDEVTDVESIMDTGFAFLARHLGGVNEPGEGMHEGISEAAC